MKLSTAVMLTINLFYLSIPAFAAAPGGVSSGLTFWLKADAGTGATNDGDQVNTWQDQSGNNYDATQSGDPTLQLNQMNFNPSVYYDGNDAHNLPSSSDVSGAHSLFTVSQMEGTTSQRVFESQVSNFIMGHHAGEEERLYLEEWLNLVFVTATTDVNMFSIQRNSSGDWEFRNRGNVVNSGSSSGMGTWRLNIGGTAIIDEPSTVFVSEVIMYNVDVTAAEANRIESYLAIKYGTTLAHNYIASDGATTFWTLGGGYDNDIAGIGRDDQSGLGQVQSKSVNSDALVTIAAVNEGTNRAPVWADVADLEFLCWGNNNGDITGWTTTGAPVPAYRLTRQWRVSVTTGDLGLVTVSVADADLPSGLVDRLYLMTDTDGDFTSGAVMTMMTESSGMWEAQLQLDDMTCFSFCYIVPTPSATPTITQTMTYTPTISPTPTISATATPTPTITLTPTESATLTHTATVTPTRTHSATVTPTRTISATYTVTMTPTPTPTITPTATWTASPTLEVAAQNLDQVIVYPNPYNADMNNRNEMVFFNLPGRAVLRLYSLDGRLVKTIVKNDNGHRVRWALDNEQGNDVASGVYLYIIKTNAQERRGKLAILR